MAIKLSGTPQQQKAPFSAFDTSSNFKSGLVDVGQAIRQVGAGQQRLQEEAKNELERKKSLSQSILASELEASYVEQVNQGVLESTRASKLGDSKALDAATKALKALNPSDPNFNINAYATGSEKLTDANTLRKALVNFRKAYSSGNTKAETERINSSLYARQVEFLNNNTSTALGFVNSNPNGVANEALLGELYKVVDDPLYVPVREGTSIGTARDAFDSSTRQGMIDRIMNQFENDAVLSAEQVQSRMGAVREILADPKFKEAGIIFNAGDEEKINDAFKAKLKQVSDVSYQKQQAQIASANVSGALSLALDADVITRQTMYNAVKPLETVDTSILTPSQLVKHQSQVSLAEMFLEGDEPLAYGILQSMANKPIADKTSLATQLKEMYGDDFVKLGLASTEQNMLSDWLHRNLTQLRNIGDNPQSLSLLSPYHADLINTIQNPSKSVAERAFAHSEAKKEYSIFVKNHPDLNGVAPPKFYVSQAQFPDQDLGNETVFVDSVMTNVQLNGAESALNHAEHRLNQGDVGGLELLRFESEKLASRFTVDFPQNPKLAEEAVSTLVSYYKSGLEPSRETDNLVTAIRQQDRKFDRDESGNVIPIISLIDLYTDTLDQSREPFYSKMLRGVVKLNEAHLLGLDDPEEQHEFIRDVFFKNKNVFPLVAATDSGSLIELPSELNKYVNPDKDRTGFVGRIFYPYGKILSNTESISNVSAIYTGAIIADMMNQHESLDVDKRLRDIIEASGGRIAPVNVDYASYAGEPSIGFSGEVSGDLQAKRTRRALLKGLLNIQVDGKPLAKISTTVQPDADGVMQKVAILQVLNKQRKYEALAMSETDRRPLTASISKAISVTDRVMPTLTDVSYTQDPIGTMREFTGLTTTYWSQLFGMEEGGMHTRAFRLYDDMFATETEATEKD